MLTRSGAVFSLLIFSSLASAQKEPGGIIPVIKTPRVAAIEQGAASSSPIRNLQGFTTYTLPANDDRSSPEQAIGFTVNFFGQMHNTLYVNNNGNVTLDYPQMDYIPYGLNSTYRQIIAAFFDDVDTTGIGSGLVTFGNDTVGGRPAFGVDYFNVGYFWAQTDALNTFQLILIGRSDTGPGNFDIEFNYQHIRWDVTWIAASAAVGYSNGTGDPGTYLQLPGSLVTGAFVDGGPYALVSGSRNSGVLGRYVFTVRNGAVCTYSLVSSAAVFTSGAGTGSVAVTASPSSCSWTAASSDPSWLQVTSSNPQTGNGTVTYSVAANPSTTPRGGTINIAERTFAVTQGGAIVPVGTITVNTNADSATWELAGTSYYRGGGRSTVIPNAPAGSYHIVYGSIDAHTTPVSQTQALAAGGSITFTGGYGITCVAPGLQVSPASASIAAGASAELRANASGWAPMHYDWFQGSSGNTSTPVGTDNPVFYTPPLSTATSYWVRARNACGQVNSATATITPVTFAVYADHAWQWRAAGDPIKVYKAAGDLLDVVVSVHNSGSVTTDVQVSMDPALVQPDFVRVYKRHSAQEIAIAFPTDVTSAAVDNHATSGTRTVRLPSQTLEATSASIPNNEFIFRFKLNAGLPSGTIVNPSATVQGQTAALLNRNRVEVRNQGDIIFTNNALLHQTYATNSTGLDSGLSSKTNRLWEAIVSAAEDRVAVIYCVDDYENPDQSDRSSVSTVQWATTRNSITYDTEAHANGVALTIGGLLEGWIQNLGGAAPPAERYVLIVGGDRVIPYYRKYEPMQDLSGEADDYYNQTCPIYRAAQSNYFFTDAIYRNTTTTNSLGSGQVQNVFVGRLDGFDPGTLIALLQAGNHTLSTSNQVVKVENSCRDGSLNAYVQQAQDAGYTIVDQTPDGKTLDYPYQPGCSARTADDPVTWSDLHPLLTNADFDVFRLISHGNTEGIYTSLGSTSHPYVTGDQLSADKGSLTEKLNVHNPIFVMDSCLNGLMDFTGTAGDSGNRHSCNLARNSGLMGHHLVDEILAMGPRAVLASSSVTESNEISDYNSLITAELLRGRTIGAGVNTASRDYGTRTGWWIFADKWVPRTLLQMNLFGAPWARISPPSLRNSGGAQLATARYAGSKPVAMRSHIAFGTVHADEGTAMQKVVSVSVSGQAVTRVDSTHSVITIPDFSQTLISETTPVLPQDEITVNLPFDAVVTSVTVSFRNAASMGVVSIPGFKPPYPTMTPPPGWTDGYVDLPVGTAAVDGGYDYNTYATSQYKVAGIRIRPVKFDPASKLASVYQNADVVVSYTTSANGLLASFATDADRYFTGASIQATTVVENTSPVDQTYTLTVQVLDGASRVLETVSVTSFVESGQQNPIAVAVPAPLTPGAYTLAGQLADSGGIAIGSFRKVVNVDSAPTADLALTLTASASSVTPGTNVTYTLTASNNGRYDATGVALGYVLPGGLTLVSATPSRGSCSGTQTVTCAIGSLANGATAQVQVVVTPSSVGQFSSLMSVSSDERDPDSTNNTVTQGLTAGTPAALSIAKAHTGAFTAGQTGTYTLTVSNATGSAATSGTVTVTESVPSGLTLASMTGTGWTCSAAASQCSRADTLAGGASYPTIAVTVNVAANAPASVVNQALVGGGGSAAASASDPTNVLVSPAPPTLVSPANGAIGVSLATTLMWNPSPGATSYDVYFGTLGWPPLVVTTGQTSYTPAAGSLMTSTLYFWRVVAKNSSGSGPSPVWSFTTPTMPQPAVALRFVAVTPCRIVDTRQAAGPFGGPTPGANSLRTFPIAQSGCNIPSTAQAYSLNVTVVPNGYLGYLSIWPAGQTTPNVSTLNSWGGIVVANAAIVPAGIGGAVNVYVSDASDVILDIDGYFDTSTGSTSYAFYPTTPCRVADTRGGAGLFGGPEMTSSTPRAFPIPSGGCSIPATARGYSLNFTVVPSGYLGYLTTWPTGQTQPNVSTLNSWAGKVVANAALVPAGTNGAISVFVSDPTAVILDTNGYFAAPGSAGALSFYPVAPCRVVDTRGTNGSLGAPEMAAQEKRSFAIPASGCSVPSTAKAYSLNVTVVPDGLLSFLTAWPTGAGQPFVSTLNSFDGSVVANAAIVPAGTNGAVSIYVTDRTHVILDINGYFAP